jgi:hypothetical protein
MAQLAYALVLRWRLGAAAEFVASDERLLKTAREEG